jgi:glucose-6-phosphate 1-dehydrogenase
MALYKQGQLEEALEILNTAWDKRLTYRHDHYLAIQEVQKALSVQNGN